MYSEKTIIDFNYSVHKHTYCTYCNIILKMSFDEEEVTLSFIAEWFDPHPQVMNKFLLKFYPKSQEVEMKDLKGTRKFLKKTKIKKYATKDFFLNAVVVIFGRDLTLVSYGDDATRALLEAASEKALVVLTKESNSNSKCSCEEIGTILSECEKSGSDLTLVNLKMFDYQFGMNQSTCSAVGTTCTREREHEHERERGSGNCLSGVCIEFRGNNSYSILEKILLGTGVEVQEVKGVVLPSASDAAAKVKAEHFCKRRNSTAKYDPEHSTCCVIKPHAVKSRMVGKIVNDIISRGLDIYAMEVVTLDRTRATEFSEVYRGLKEYNGKD